MSDEQKSLTERLVNRMEKPITETKDPGSLAGAVRQILGNPNPAQVKRLQQWMKVRVKKLGMAKAKATLKRIASTKKDWGDTSDFEDWLMQFDAFA